MTTLEEVDKMRVAEVRNQLTAVGLSTDGLKAELRDRLKEYIQAQADEAVKKKEMEERAAEEKARAEAGAAEAARKAAEDEEEKKSKKEKKEKKEKKDRK